MNSKLKKWELIKLVLPQHTDQAGVMWHGCYLNFLEEARINALDKVITNIDNNLKVLKKDVDENKTRSTANNEKINSTSKKSDKAAQAKMKSMG